MTDAIMSLEPREGPHMIVNSALMQISQYYKEEGLELEWHNPLSHQAYKKIWVSSLFDFSPRPGWVFTDRRAIYGGSGFNLDVKLPDEIAKRAYDYSIYPECDFSIMKFSGGCIYAPSRHPYCIVPRLEGKFKDLEPKPLNPRGRRVLVTDNNFFASSRWRENIEYLKKIGQPVDFHTGIDIRLMDREKWEALLSLDVHRRASIKIAWDDPREDLRPIIDRALQYVRPYMLLCYVLIGYWSTEAEDTDRLEWLRSRKIDPFAMPYKTRKPGESDREYKDRLDYMARRTRHTAHKAIFKSVPWSEYRPGIKKGALA